MPLNFYRQTKYKMNQIQRELSEKLLNIDPTKTTEFQFCYRDINYEKKLLLDPVQYPIIYRRKGFDPKNLESQNALLKSFIHSKNPHHDLTLNQLIYKAKICF